MSSIVRVIQRNTFYSLASSAVRLFANAVLFILVAKFYGPITFGQFTTAHTLAIIFTLIADFGFDLFFTIEIAKNKDRVNYLAPRMFGIKIILSSTALLLMCTYAVCQTLSEDTRVLVIIFSLYLFFSAILNSLFALFRGHDELHHEAFITLTINIILLIVITILGIIHADIKYIALSFVGSRVIGFCYGLIKSSHFVDRMLPVFDFQWFKTIWKEVSIFGLFFIFGNLYFIQDTILISIWKGDYEVGIYQSVFRVLGLVLVFSDVMISAAVPSLSRLYDTNQVMWEKLSNTVNKILMHIGLLLGFVMIVGAEKWISILYGLEHYSDAVPLMKIFGFVVIIRYSVEVYALMLTTSKRQNIRTIFVIIATIFNILLNYYAIPVYGILGASVVSLCTNSLLGIAYFISIRKILSYNWLTMDRVIPSITIIIFIMIISFIPILAFWYVLLLTIVAYTIILSIYGYNREEKNIMLQYIMKIINKKEILT